MKAVTIRIGNDIPLVWRFFTREGTEKIPYIIEGKDTKIVMTNCFGGRIAVTPEINGNAASWTFRGKEQKNTGGYTLTFYENFGEDGMKALDKIKPFELVPWQEVVMGGTIEGCCSSMDVSPIVMESELSGGVTTYAELPDKPQINGVTLQGNLSSSDLHIGDSFGLPRRVIRRAPFAFEAWFDSVDYKLAEDALLPVGGCSSFLAGTEYGRNLDWTYDNHAECIVHIAASAGRYASDAVSGNLAGFDDIEGYEIPADKWKMIACRVLDGRNEKGVIINTNVVPIEPDTDFEYCIPASGTWETDLSAVMIPRFVLDNFATARAAAEYLQSRCRIHIPATLRLMGYRAHYMIADASGEAVIIELVNGQVAVVNGLRQMTNFITDHIVANEDGTVYTPDDVASGHSAVKENNIQPHGSGLERWNLIVRMREGGSTAEEICRALFYSNAYNPLTTPYWHTEFTGPDMHGKDLRVDSDAKDFAEYEALAQAAWVNRSRETGLVWHTSHSTIYDIANNTMRVCFQEEGNYEEVEVQTGAEPAPVPEEGNTLIYSATPTSETQLALADDIQPALNKELIASGKVRFAQVTIDASTAVLPVVLTYNGRTHIMITASGIIDEDVYFAGVKLELDYTFIEGIVEVRPMGGDADNCVSYTEDQYRGERDRMRARSNLGIYGKGYNDLRFDFKWDGKTPPLDEYTTGTGQTYSKIDDLAKAPDDFTEATIDSTPHIEPRGHGDFCTFSTIGDLAEVIVVFGDSVEVVYDWSTRVPITLTRGVWVIRGMSLSLIAQQEYINTVPPEYLPGTENRYYCSTVTESGIDVPDISYGQINEIAERKMEGYPVAVFFGQNLANVIGGGYDNNKKMFLSLLVGSSLVIYRQDDEDTVAIMVTPLDNAVRYDTAQGLTPEQKQQARENIGITEEIMNLIYAGL